MTFALDLAFDRAAPSFAHGFEVGSLWSRLQHTDEPVEQMVHVVNAEMVLRIAEATGRDVRCEEHDETWMTIRFEPPGDAAS